MVRVSGGPSVKRASFATFGSAEVEGDDDDPSTSRVAPPAAAVSPDAGPAGACAWVEPVR